MTGELTFRSVVDGGSQAAAFHAALRELRAQCEDKEFEYELDLALFVGGEMITVTDPTGMINPRVSTARNRVTATIRINSVDAEEAIDPRGLLWSTVHGAVEEIFERIALRDSAFDADRARAEITFLRVTAAESSPRAEPRT